jgi:hypothetical protein
MTNIGLQKKVTPHVMSFLIKEFLESIIVREFNKIDITVLDRNGRLSKKFELIIKNVSKEG